VIATAPISLRVARPDGETRARDLFFGGFALAWLGYTYWYPQLHAVHATIPVCPFYALTGHPCPFCGGTRSFSAMWRGDIGAAAHYYPAGPLLFALTFPVALYGAWALMSRRTVRFGFHPRLETIGLVGAGALLLANWSLKLFWLGN
jgi:hypothetical protein